MTPFGGCEMSYNEKVNIYVPEEIGRLLRNDARLFEILKTDMYSINLNRLMTLIIIGYYDLYREELNNASNKIKRILEFEEVDSEKVLSITNSIINEIVEPQVPNRKGKHPDKLSLKPTKETESIINNIPPSEYVSQYLCKLLVSYCGKPFYQRERIVFKDKYDFIIESCLNNKPIVFSTIWNKDTVHTVVPYKIVYSKEEMYNYLLCEEINKDSGKQETRSYRLNRIYNVRRAFIDLHLTDENEHFFKKMEKYGPQYPINKEEKICISLNDQGVKFFNRVYTGRPDPIKREQTKTGYNYFFDCSLSQIEQYLRKFEDQSSYIIKDFS